VRQRADAVDALLAEAFVEVGSSGRVYRRDQIIEMLSQEPPVERSLSHFKTLVLAPGVVPATYRAVRYLGGAASPEPSLRSSIWKQIDGRWQMLFHQGTAASDVTSDDLSGGL
jgi:hypothetical protein